jgi:hypothetical protein
VVVPVPLHSTIHTVHHNVMTKVEFPTLVKQRPFYIFLKDVCFVSAIIMLFLAFQDGFYLIEVKAYNNTVTSVGVFARLNDPSIEFIY